MLDETPLIGLGESTASAAAATLGMLGVTHELECRQVVTGAGAARAALATVHAPAVAVTVSYVDGVVGGNSFVLSRRAGRRLAGLLIGGGSGEDDDGPLDELEESALQESMNQAIAAAARVTSEVIDVEIDISIPVFQNMTAPEAAMDFDVPGTYVVVSEFRLFDEACVLVQQIPHAFLVRLGDRLGQAVFTPAPVGAQPAGQLGPVSQAIRELPVTVEACFGRTRMPIADVIGIRQQEVVTLDELAHQPVRLLVNGKDWAEGALFVTHGGNWALRIESLHGRTADECT